MLPQSFYARDAKTVARALLGCLLVYHSPTGCLRLRIVETEAYLGIEDAACHAAKGRTPRTEVMFGAAGYAYVYLIYGMYHMLNIVTAQAGQAHAVLLRAAEPCPSGINSSDKQDRDKLKHNKHKHTNGPGKLCRALGIDRSHNGLALTAPPLYLEPGTPPAHIACSPRIGIDYAGAWKDAPLRFYDADSRYVSHISRPRRAQKRTQG